MNHHPSSAQSTNHLVILSRGEELISSLESFAAEQGLVGAWLAGLGGSMKLTLGFYDFEAREYLWKDFDGALEIVSLTGDMVILDGKPFWHVHGVFSGADYGAISGHVKSLTIGLTGELMITPLDAPLTRTYDETTGLKLIGTAS